ncbi:glycosyltransferase family 2 protein [Bordetella genomosp. 4]|uniref:Glycosyltransferase 2-like domain-containing protein n=1 Tax=Bordetella genomosp. 4 TaxID=463044 RepID=A0A261U449_9BORD|nr:glycosyltransferase [Bordetella genomosp. 4]OZI56395.1 hypothetical protein CAL20_13250 [Bordetella genomosp. 4]
MIFRRRNQKPPSEESIACSLIRSSDLFDSAWYLDQYPDVMQAGFDPVLHYVRHGAKEGRRPGPWFDIERYLGAQANRAAIQNPLLHYLENRDKFILPEAAPKRGYSSFGEFLNCAMLSPVTLAPFKEEDKRCFAVMESIAKYLVRQTNGDETLKISVIMPVRNRARTLQQAIDSVVAQRYRNFELIIVDDGSNDASVSIAQTAMLRDSRIRLIRIEQPRGVCVARNVGLANATGEIVGYLDSDNTWLEDYLGAAVGAFRLLPTADAIYGGQYIYAESDLSQLSAVRFGPMNVSLLEQHNYIDLNCFLHKRNIVEKGIRFDESLQRLVDWDFILRINSGFRIISIPVLLSRYYLHAAEDTITKTVDIGPALQTIAFRNSQTSLLSTDNTLKKRICVIIPSYQALHFLRDCINALASYLDQDLFELIVVDNNSDHEVKQYLKSIENKKIKIIFNDVNYGFSYAVNQGATMASLDADIVLMNNDARIEAGGLTRLQEIAYEASDIAMSVPRQVLPAGAENISLHVPYATTSLACDVSLSKHHKNIASVDLFHDGRRVELSFAPFFCVYIKRPVWDACGGLDYENGRHYRSDRIMCDFIKQVLRQRIVYTPDATVHHGAQIATRELAQRDGDGNEYDSMLTKNIWPADLAARLKIDRRPWASD